MCHSFSMGATAPPLIIAHRPSLPLPPRFFRIPFSGEPHHHLRLASATCSHTDIPEPSGIGSSSRAENQGSVGKDDKSSHSNSSNEILDKLKRYGVSGVLSYGLLNTAYYLTTFLVVWFYVAPAPGRVGYLAAVKRFLKIMAMVWAGSQVTKLVRAGGAVALAPFVDRGLSWFGAKFGFESQGKAFMAIAGICFGLAFLMFLGVTILSA
ncbi:uncharacterized protein LOC127239464 isoform X2 [Andrographis paniculata]|uniref:uncharacterized protein LOC127239464 isoform X2 n=1 Tax=Andrographis paniculata TaxID=175694 RepID=UPI0021E85ECD|nr:uncharacterized protein LOC127239464 isoform X2 [Andrographis paniculata]